MFDLLDVRVNVSDSVSVALSEFDVLGVPLLTVGEPLNVELVEFDLLLNVDECVCEAVDEPDQLRVVENDAENDFVLIDREKLRVGECERREGVADSEGERDCVEVLTVEHESTKHSMTTQVGCSLNITCTIF